MNEYMYIININADFPAEAIELMAENILTNPHREEYAIETETVPDLDSVPVQEKPQVKVINIHLSLFPPSLSLTSFP